MLTEKLSKLETLSKELDKERDTLIKVVSDLDNKLSPMKIRLEVWIRPDGFEHWQLGYGLCKSKTKGLIWCLALKYRNTTWRLDTATRLVLIQAVPHLENLVDIIIEKSEEALKKS